jgi:hypothetical protein
MNAYRFFLSNAGYSYNPSTETKMQGHIRCARSMAAAEQMARNNNCSFEWEWQEDDITSADWCAPNEDGGRNREPWGTWACIMRDADGKVVQSLGGVDFGRDGTPWDSTYRRVVEAELACEHFA